MTKDVNPNHRYGAQLKIGDVIKVWWSPGTDTILALKPYKGPYETHAGWEHCQIATFAILPSKQMTIFAGEDFELAHE